jgi:Domain of unknown function (DUF4258)
MKDITSVVSFRLTQAKAQERIREIAKTSEFVKLTSHAKKRMAERDIVIKDVYHILRQGHIEGDPKLADQGDWKCKMVLALKGRRVAGVVTAIVRNATLVVITVEWEDTK